MCLSDRFQIVPQPPNPVFLGDYDLKSNLFMLGGLLPRASDFGFIPSTLGDDGHPLDIMVLMDAPAHVGCLIDVRIIGIIDAEQTENGKTEKNSRLLGTAIPSYGPPGSRNHRRCQHDAPLSGREVFVSYNKQRGKNFRISDTGGPKKAICLLKNGIKAHKNAGKK